MARFSDTNSVAGPKKAQLTHNRAGGQAYAESDRLALASLLLTTFLKDEFYRTGNQAMREIITLIPKAGPLFAAKAAVYARNEFGMRSATHLVAAEIAHQVKGEPWVRTFLNAVVRRPDDITEILGCYLALHKKPIPNSLKRGLGAAFSKFDAYQIAKYKRSNATLSLVDAINLLHPPHTDPIGQLVKGTLAAPETWETKVSAAGPDEEAKSTAWKDLIESGKIGYMALLRNLRNILQSCENDPQTIFKATQLLVDENRIRKSLVFPFRYLSAFKELRKLNGPAAVMFARGVSQAADISLKNLPDFPGSTLVVLDGSGSMTGGRCGDNSAAEVGAMFSAALVKHLGADFMIFDNDAKYVLLDPTSSVIGLATSMQFPGGGTNFRSVFQRANRKYDRIIILSDMQGWIGYYSPRHEFQDYCKRHGASPRVFSFDLTGLGTLQFPEQNVYALAGFSDKTLPLMAKLDQGGSLVETILAYTWETPSQSNE